MSATGLRAFDSTIQKTNIWLDDILDELRWDSPERAYHALRAVLHTLRDHLPLHESAQLAAQLPQLIRGMYYEGWKPNHVPAKERHWEQFVSHVSESFALDPEANGIEITQAVLAVLAKHISEGEITDVKRCLPEDLRRHWITKR
jgi:uncharacterized protein (DUF2267 family)